MSAANAYKKPQDSSRSWTGHERRNPDPINQFGHRLNQLCLEATDPFEIAAHVEALGYNQYRVQREFGVADPFALGRILYAQTPHRPAPRREAHSASVPWTTRLLLLVPFALAIILQLLLGKVPWSGAIWVLLWAQAGSALLWQARARLEPRQTRAVLTLLLLAGLGGLVPLGVAGPYGWTVLVVSTIWIGIAVLTWAEHPWRAALFPLPAVGLAAVSLPPAASLAASLLLLAALLWRVPAVPDPAVILWSLRRLPSLAPYAMYGLGEGLLLSVLLRGSGLNALPGLLLFVLMLIVAELAVHQLLASVKHALWRETAEGRFVLAARLRWARYLLLCAVPALCAAVIGIGFSWQRAALLRLDEFALLGLAVSLGLAHLTLLRPHWVGGAFLAGAGLAVSGVVAPWIALLVVVLLLLVAGLRQLGRVYTYGTGLL